MSVQQIFLNKQAGKIYHRIERLFVRNEMKAGIIQISIRSIRLPRSLRNGV
jgi:hypothetical protein